MALEADVTPLHYLRNLAQLGVEGQIRLLRSSVCVAGHAAVLERAVEILATNGVGRITLLAPPSPGSNGEASARLAGVARNRNGSCDVETRPLALKTGNPATAVAGADAVGACLEESMEEQLLQFACRVGKIPAVLAGVEGSRGQATTVLPGDPGVALVYRPSHPHLEPSRTGAEAEVKASLMVGTWLAEQLTRLVVGEGELLRGRLLYADLNTGELSEYPLAGPDRS